MDNYYRNTPYCSKLHRSELIFSKENSSGEGITIKMNKSSGQYYPSCEFHRSDGTGSARNVDTSSKKIDGDIPCLIRFQRQGETFKLLHLQICLIILTAGNFCFSNLFL